MFDRDSCGLVQTAARFGRGFELSTTVHIGGRRTARTEIKRKSGWIGAVVAGDLALV